MKQHSNLKTCEMSWRWLLLTKSKRTVPFAMPKRPQWIDNPLREYRHKNCLLQAEAAKRVGIHYSMWSLLENLKRSPSLELAGRISKRTGIPVPEIIRFCMRRKRKVKSRKRVVRGSGVDLRDRIET